MPNKREGGNSPYHSQAAWNRWQRVEIHNDAVIGHSQGAIDALRDAPDFARYNPRLTIIAVDPPRTSVLFHCVRSVRYLDLHTGDFGLGGGSLSCPQAQNLAMGGLHITLPMRSDNQEQI